MSKKKVNFATSNRSSLTSQCDSSPQVPALSSSSSKANRAAASFQLVRCNVCQAEIMKKDHSKHDESLCKNLIESSLQLATEDELSAVLLAIGTNIFEIPFLLNRRLLFSSSTHTVDKSKLQFDKPIDVANVILLSPELMMNCKLTSGQYVSVQYCDNREQTRKYHLIVQAYEHLRNCFTIGFLKNSPLENVKDTIIRLDLGLSTDTLQSLNLEIQDRFFTDPFVHISCCCAFKKQLIHKVITSVGSELSIELNTSKDQSTKYRLIVKDFVAQSHLNPLEDIDFDKLSLAERDIAKASGVVYIISEECSIIFSQHKQLPTSNHRLAGYVKQMDLLEHLILNSMSSNLDLPQTIILTGPSGTGKTLAMEQLFRQMENRMNLFKVHCSRFLSKSFEFEKLSNAFKNLSQLKPSLLFLDNLEDISNEKNYTEKKLVSWLKLLLDELPKKEPVIVVAATSRVDLLDPSLRRPGRFDIEIEFPIPSPGERKLILKQMLANTEVYLDEQQQCALADSAHGFTGADLKHLCEMSMLNVLNLKENKANAVLSYEQLMATLPKVRPSVMREISLEKPNVGWSDIGGLYELRGLLEETIVWPIKHPDAFVRMGIEPPRGILMYGPPGCCKTMIGKALASESGLNFFSIKGPELFSKWVGESERAIREMFRKARAASPSILFFDEIDALAAERGQTQSAVGDRVLAQLLTEIDGVEKLSQVVIIAATNRPDIVDKALLRPGRLDSMVYVPLPDLLTRREIFRIRIFKMPIAPDLVRDHLIDRLATKSEGYTGAEVTAVCQRAGLSALSEMLNAPFVTEQHFEKAFEKVRPRIDAQTIKYYNEFAARCNELRIDK